MQELTPANTLAFLKRFRLDGSIIRRFTLRNLAEDRVAAKLLLTVFDTSANAKVKLAIQIQDVEEYRFQKRPGTQVFQVRTARIAKFDGITFLNLDAEPDDPAPKVMDFRISDCFIAGAKVAWKIVE